MHKFIQGGSDEARLVPYEKDEMRKQNTQLSDRQKESLYTQYVLGEKVADLAQSYNVAESSVYRYLAEMRKKKEGKMPDSIAVAGDAETGQLICTEPSRHKYYGTCVVGGETKEYRFTASNNKVAMKRWERWKSAVSGEDEFMAMVERRKPDAKSDMTEQLSNVVEQLSDVVGEEAAQEYADALAKIPEVFPATEEEIANVASRIDEVDITPAPVPEIAVKPWRQVAEERQAEIDELRKQVEYLQGRVEGLEGASDNVIACTEQPEPKLRHWFNDNGSFFVAWKNKPIYVLWAKSESPRFFGVYERMDDALRKVDELNEVAAFLGNASAFEVEEVAWR